MATFQSDAVVADIMPDHSLAGVVQCRTIKYTAAAEMAIASIIEMFPAKVGMEILGMDLKWTATTALATINIGETDPDRFFAALDIAAAGAAALIANGAPATGLNYIYTADDTVDIVLAGAVIPAAAVITMNVYYKMQGAIADEG